MKLPRTPASRIGLAAAAVAGAVGLALVTGFGPAPVLSSIASGQAQDDSPSSSSTSSTIATPTTVDPSQLDAGTRVVDAGGAGTVTVSESGGQLALVSAVPSTGWSVEVERSAGREVEVDFRRGAQRVQVNLELEDGVVRERVRVRDDAAGTEFRIEDGVIVRTEDSASSGSGGPGGDGGVVDDHGGSTGSDRRSGGADDAPGDDHGGSTQTGGDSGRGGADDPPGDDHGTDG